MAVMINLAQQALQVCPDDLPLTTVRQQLQQTLAALRRDLRSSTEALCQRALAVLPPQSTVLTYSNSTTVIAALRYAHDHGRIRRVLLSESRPAYDGRPQAADQGLYTPEALRLRLQQQELSPALQRLTSGRTTSNH